MNDLMAAGAMAALREAGRSVPEDISVVGFDDLPVAIDVTPTLTTVRLDLPGIGAAAMELVLAGEPEPRTVPMPAELMIRGSTGPVGGDR
jgi:LacI family transcriptional regulator